MNTLLLSDHSFCNETYMAKPSVQATGSGRFQGVVTIAAREDDMAFTRHTTPAEYDCYQDAFTEAKRRAYALIREMQHT